jgi:hypothetical protein
MITLDDLKKQWSVNSTDTDTEKYNEESIKSVINKMMKKQNNTIMKYFWGSFTLQIIVYAMLSHVIVRYWGNVQVVIGSILGIIIFMPFTWIMMKKFKKLAIAKSNGASMQSIRQYVEHQRTILSGFFKFKIHYEWVLIPLSSALGVWLVFELFFPGGVEAFINGALITYALTLISCYAAIRSENRKRFIEPLNQMDEILREYALEDENK